MAGTRDWLAAGEVLAGVEVLLDRLDPDRSGIDAAGWLRVVGLARRVRQRIEALTDVFVAEADRAQAAERAKGTPLASWLGSQETLSRREAKSAVYRARRLAEHPRVAEAATTGRIGTGQARAISGVLDSLQGSLNPAQHNAAEQVLLELSGHLDADQLTQAAPQVLARVAPVDADELLEHKLQREAEQGHRQRSLRFFTQAGAVKFDGSLPRVEGHQFMALIDAKAEQLRRTAIENRDPLATRPTYDQRRADALIALLNPTRGNSTRGRAGGNPLAGQTGPGTTTSTSPHEPATGGDGGGPREGTTARNSGDPREAANGVGTDGGNPRQDTADRDSHHPGEPDAGTTGGFPGVDGGAMPSPAARIIVKLDYQQLHQQAAGAGLINNNQPISAAELRQLCCNAELIPAVLGSQSEILDLGRAQRLANKPLWTALTLRDGGCAFPGCHTHPAQCEAHHITPWWQGGPTNLDNLVLLCHEHHSLCEPAKHNIRDQWQIHPHPGQQPQFTPPARYGPTQLPRQENPATQARQHERQPEDDRPHRSPAPDQQHQQDELLLDTS